VPNPPSVYLKSSTSFYRNIMEIAMRRTTVTNADSTGIQSNYQSIENLEILAMAKFGMPKRAPKRAAEAYLAYLREALTTTCSPTIWPPESWSEFLSGWTPPRRKSKASADGVDCMSDMTYSSPARQEDKPLIWLCDRISTPPFTLPSRREAGTMLRQIQTGVSLEMPYSRPLPNIGVRCHELRINEKTKRWRIIYRIESDAILVLAFFQKMGRTTPKLVIDECKAKLARHLRKA
jgi:phage-related protein